MNHELETNSAGVWSWYGDHRREIAGHAAEPGGAFTVFWGGEVSAARLRDFVAEAGAVLADRGPAPTNYATTVLTDRGKVETSSASTPLLPTDLKASAGFVRFECGPPGSSAAVASDPVLVAWARLDHPPRDQTDAIGVFCAPPDMRLLRPQIARLVSETSHAHLGYGAVADILDRLEAELGGARMSGQIVG